MWALQNLSVCSVHVDDIMEKVPHLVHELLDQLKILRADTLRTVDQQHEVDVGRLAG